MYVGVGLTATLLASRTVVSGVSWPDTCDETILRAHVATMQISQMRAAILQSLKIKRTEDYEFSYHDFTKHTIFH